MRIIWPVPREKARIDVAFLDPGYPTWRRRNGLTPDEHPGIDINISGTSGNADYGYPVVAIADGQVIHARRHRVWGNVVLIQHEHPVAGVFWSQYAHLAHICVGEQYIWAGEPVGSIGIGDPLAPFMAHLHFEIRTQPLAADYWPGRNRAFIQQNYVDPVKFLNKYYAPERRFWRPIVRTYGDRLVGPVVINLGDTSVAHIRFDDKQVGGEA